ncbi:MAG: hypothetical protein QME40_01040 [bacterium]|nr:hypothetical protein [bacterium]
MRCKILVFAICAFLSVSFNAFCEGEKEDTSKSEVMEIENGISSEQTDELVKALFEEFRYAITALKEVCEGVSEILEEAKKIAKEEVQKKVEEIMKKAKEDKKIVERSVKKQIEEARREIEIVRQKIVSVLDKVQKAIEDYGKGSIEEPTTEEKVD